ncbi:hypothetical protein HYU40_02385 [Candidatus Woesearchaeota archaeon]|nr:hypothetical protein [Candidatus Woesearchaeota archaeon]
MVDNLPKEHGTEGAPRVYSGIAVSFLEEVLAEHDFLMPQTFSELTIAIRKYAEARRILDGFDLDPYVWINPDSPFDEPPLIPLGKWKAAVRRFEQTAVTFENVYKFLEQTGSLEMQLAKLQPGIIFGKRREGKYMFFYVWADASLHLADLYRYASPPRMEQVKSEFLELEKVQLSMFGFRLFEASDRRLEEYLADTVGKETINKYFTTCENALRFYTAAASVYNIAKLAGVDLHSKLEGLPEEIPKKMTSEILNFMLLAAKCTGRQDILDKYSPQQG